MISKSTKKLRNDIKNFKKNPIQNIYITLNNNDLYNWKIIFFAPEKSRYEGIVFTFKLSFPDNYPFRCPNICFPNGICACSFSDSISNWVCTSRISELLTFIFDNFNSPKDAFCFRKQLDEYIPKIKDINIKNNYIFLNEITKDGFCSIFNVKDKTTKEKRVIKVINKIELMNKLKSIYINDIDKLQVKYHKFINDLYDEISILDMEIIKNCDNIVKYYDNYHNKNEFGLILELCDENLISFLEKKNN